jgi:hypothetical protein
MRRGDVRGASSTLERLSLLRPGDPSVRLLYGVVLYRLDDAVASERELLSVLALPDVPDHIRREAQDYLRLARSRQRNAHFDARLSFGGGYDDNVNAAPDGDVALFAGSPLVLPETSRRKEDSNIQFIGSLGGSYDLGGPKGHTAFVRVTYFRGEQRVFNTIDLQAYNAEAGVTLRTPWVEFRPSVSFDHVLLSQSTYLRARTETLRAQKRLSRRWGLFAEFSHSDQDFVDTPIVRTAQEREGAQFDYEAGATWVPTPVDRFALTARHRRKHARVVANAYRREGAGLEWTRLFGKGVFFVGTVEGQFDRYERPDAFVHPTTRRHDDAVRLEFLTGVPMSLFWKSMRSFTVSLGYENFRQASNIVNYDYTNNRLSALITYQWGI